MNLPAPKSETQQNSPVKYLKVSLLGDLALDLWRLQNRIGKLKDKIGEEDLKPITYFLDSCERNLKEIGIETKDYTDQIYKSSMNVDVVTYESIEMDGDEATVKETLEPAVLFDNELLHKAKVVIATPKP